MNEITESPFIPKHDGWLDPAVSNCDDAKPDRQG